MLKLDVEGAENDELKDPLTLQWLFRAVKIILIEWHPYEQEKPLESFENLRKIGFKPFFTEFRILNYRNIHSFFQVESLINCNYNNN